MGDKTIRTRLLLAGVLSLSIAGCGGGAEDKDAKAPDQAADASCADDGERLKLTGLCKGRAVNYLSDKINSSIEPPEGCEWQVLEAQLPAEEVLLYHGLVCGDKKVELQVAGGAERAELQIVKTAFMGGDNSEPWTIGYMYTAEGDPAKAVTDRARSVIEDPAEAAKCNARPAKNESWPSDAMVVDTDPNGSSSEDGSPVAVCGDLGYFDEGNRYWRVSQGYAWFFDFGQDMVEIDPGSFTIMAKDAEGNWGAI